MFLPPTCTCRGLVTANFYQPISKPADSKIFLAFWKDVKYKFVPHPPITIDVYYQYASIGAIVVCAAVLFFLTGMLVSSFCGWEIYGNSKVINYYSVLSYGAKNIIMCKSKY